MDAYEIRRQTEKFAEFFKENLKSKVVIEDTVVIIETVTPSQLAKTLSVGASAKDSILNGLELVQSLDLLIERTIVPCSVGPILVIYELT